MTATDAVDEPELPVMANPTLFSSLFSRRPPVPAATIARATRWVHSRTWVRLDRISASHPFPEVSSRSEWNVPPALFTRIDGVPSASTVRARAASTWPASRTSSTHSSAPISWATDAADCGSFSQIATRAPNSAKPAAMPRPMPAPPPVTTATRPSRATASRPSTIG